MPQFAEISPDVGELDEAALADEMERDADQALALLADMTRATDARLRALARALAARLFLDLARQEPADATGIGRVVTMPYRPDRGDLDVDASLDGLLQARAGGRAIDPDELAIRAWAKPSTAWCLLVDRSGSMHGAPLATAALAASAVAARAEGQYAVLCFGREVVAPKAIWETRSDEDVIDRVLALRGHGTTDVAGALLAAGAQLRQASAPRRVAIMLSDCRATEPGDVVAAARGLDDLVIVAPEGDSVEAAELAAAVGARFATVAGPSSIVPALVDVLDR
ncbi:MAG: VWA domain-containing protein [Ilumatobacter sp.]|nr:VWA domain-containing protein [Ilumatobacter sp.]